MTSFRSRASAASACAVLAVGSAGPIGVFDSGVGGLSVLREIRALLPYENLLYVADSAHAPYGDRPDSYVRERCIVLARFLLEQGAKALVVACNTGSASGADALRALYTTPVIAMEPAVKAAAAATRNGIVGVLATVGTSASARFASLVERFGTEIEVVTVPAPGLVEHIERGELNSVALHRLLEGYVATMVDRGADVIVLSCTHYVFLRPLIAEMVGPQIALIDTGPAVARQLGRVLTERALLNEESATGSERFWSSSTDPAASQIVSGLYGITIEVEVLPPPFR